MDNDYNFDLEELLNREQSLLEELYEISKEREKIIKKIIKPKNIKTKIPKDESARHNVFRLKEEKLKERNEIIQQPSLRYKSWENKKSLDWTHKDIIGYWAYKYFETYYEEDIELISQTIPYKLIAKIKSITKTNSIDCKKYIDWFFDNLDGDLDWMDNTQFSSCFSKAVLKLYLGQGVRKRKTFKQREDELSNWDDVEVDEYGNIIEDEDKK